MIRNIPHFKTQKFATSLTQVANCNIFLHVAFVHRADLRFASPVKSSFVLNRLSPSTTRGLDDGHAKAAAGPGKQKIGSP
jgi:hypothetical protein